VTSQSDTAARTVINSHHPVPHERGFMGQTAYFSRYHPSR